MFCVSLTFVFVKLSKDQPDCFDDTYLTSIGLRDADAYCIINPEHRDDINGSYGYVGCDAGLPYYQLDYPGTPDIFLHFDWCFAWWLIGEDITTISVYAYCSAWDILDCTNDLQEYVPLSSGFVQDTSVTINQCTPRPTTSPTNMPTNMPVDPTTSPSLRPSNMPTIPTVIPTSIPTGQPSNAPVGPPTTSFTVTFSICYLYNII